MDGRCSTTPPSQRVVNPSPGKSIRRRPASSVPSTHIFLLLVSLRRSLAARCRTPVQLRRIDLYQPDADYTAAETKSADGDDDVNNQTIYYCWRLVTDIESTPNRCPTNSAIDWAPRPSRLGQLPGPARPGLSRSRRSR